MVLRFINSRRRRLILALLLAMVTGPAFAIFTEDHVQRFPRPPVLEYDPGTVFISRYLGKPLEDTGDWEADPADATKQPNLDRFYSAVASRIKAAVGDQRTTYSAFIQGIGACKGDCGWPFVSRDFSYRVTACEIERFDGRPPVNHMFRAGEDGRPPERPWGWWGNAVVGLVASGLTVFGSLTLIAMWLRRTQLPIAGFPVIVSATQSGSEDAIAENVIPKE